MNDEDISDKDKQLFREACRDVIPLKKTKVTLKAERSTNSARAIKPKLKPPIALTPLKQNAMPQSILPDYVKPDEVTKGLIEFSRPGIAHKTLRTLRRGEMPLEKKLDLHGKTKESANRLLDAFIQTCYREHIRCALIIHGKGQFILKSFLSAYLRACPIVMAYVSAQPPHGGDGALYVLFKRSL